jgi:DnaK suppressor protein
VDHLTESQIEELRAELAVQMDKLERSMRVTDQALDPVELDQSALGRLSRADALQTQGLTRNLQEREQIKLAHVQEALRRMDEGTYGRCVVCDSHIRFQRLYVFPETPTCAACGANP